MENQIDSCKAFPFHPFFFFWFLFSIMVISDFHFVVVVFYSKFETYAVTRFLKIGVAQQLCSVILTFVCCNFVKVHYYLEIKRSL